MATRLVAINLLTRVMDDQRNLDALCDRQHGLKEYLALAENDRALARAIVVTACRNHARIERALSKTQDRPPPKRARFLIHALHVAAAQMLFMDVPESAAVDLAVSAIGDDPRTTRFRGFANAVLRRMAREREQISGTFETVPPFPSWLGKALRKDFGKDKLEKISQAVYLPPNLDLTVKSDPKGWAERLSGKMLPNGTVRLSGNTPVVDLEGYEAGEWWVQDAAASVPAKLVKAAPGARVLELCAAPGGKTAQLANAGFDVTALDISAPRLKRLGDNLERLGLSAALIQADILEWEPVELFDAVLLDAPCSSTGTIRRHPDVMWTKTAADVSDLAKLQLSLLLKAATFVRPGGSLVFSNCSMLKEEGENLLSTVLEQASGLTLDRIGVDELFGVDDLINGQGAVRSLPFHFSDEAAPEMGGMDGFFAARFVKA